MTRAVLILTTAMLVGAFGCGRVDQPSTRPDGEPEDALTAAEVARPWAALSVPRPANEAPYVVRDAKGFVALARELTGDGKVVGPTYNYLYRSEDGVTWHSLPLPVKADSFGLRDLGYGAGRYVMVGNLGDSNEIWTSTDLAEWSTQPFDLTGALSRVRRVNGRFFALSVFRDFLVSDDGMAWSLIPSLTLQQNEVAFGNGLFVVVGSGPIAVSPDGQTWEERAPDCTLPGACIQDPSGGTHEGPYSNVVFAKDRFYVDQLVSTDATTWQANAGPQAVAYVGGYLFGDATDGSLPAWQPGETTATSIAIDPPVSATPLSGGTGAETITTPLPGGETCLSHRCVLVGGVLYLIR